MNVLNIKKWKLFFSYENEEKWLNEMASKGYFFVDYNFPCYTFVKGTPGEYIYRIELLKGMPNTNESRDYMVFLEETGVECVTTFYRWAYFRRKKELGPFELFTDFESRIIHYNRIALLMKIIIILNIIIFIINYSISNINFWISIINILVALLLLPVLITHLLKIKNLKKAKVLSER